MFIGILQYGYTSIHIKSRCITLFGYRYLYQGLGTLFYIVQVGSNGWYFMGIYSILVALFPRKSARSFTQPKGIVHSLTGNIYMFIIRMGIERKATPCICPGNRSNKGLFVLGILNAPSGHSRPSVRWEYFTSI